MTAVGGLGNDTLIGGKGNDWLADSSGQNRMQGGAGDDTLGRLPRDNVMEGGAGNDRYYVDSANDQVIEQAGKGIDAIITSLSFDLSANGAQVEELYSTAQASRTAPATRSPTTSRGANTTTRSTARAATTPVWRRRQGHADRRGRRRLPGRPGWRGHPQRRQRQRHLLSRQ
jgi:Ca2+-binding RTX toxin-like protein